MAGLFDLAGWLKKGERTLTSLLPVDASRTGECKSCGACCELPVRCPALRYNGQGKSFCAVYSLRPLNCRKYPRTAREQVTKGTCGYRFDEQLRDS